MNNLFFFFLFLSSILSAEALNYWKLDEVTQPYLDTYGTANGICGTDCPVLGVGQVENAQIFDGSNDEINVIDNGTIDWSTNDSFTIEFWMKPNNTTNLQVAIGRHQGTSGTASWWIGREGSKVKVYLDGSQLISKSDIDINGNTWTHIAVVRDSNGEKILYVNGAEDNRTNVSASDYSGNEPLNIGWFYDQYWFDGTLDEIVIFNSAVSDINILEDYQNGLDGKSFDSQNSNTTPTADAGSDQSIETGTPAILDGSASSDADGDAFTYSWIFTSQPIGSTATLINPTAVNPTFTPDVDGEYVVQLIVNDGTVDSISASVIVTASIIPPLENIPPTADAGADQSVQVNNTITITGSGTDSDGTITAYEWKKDTTVLATTPSFSYTPDTVGTDTLTLTVTDNNGSIGIDSMDVVVTTDTPPPPSTLYEAEDAEISSQFTIASYHLDYTGTGYVDYAGEGYVKWTVDIAADGNYDVAFRYALGSGNRPLNISVDGTGGGTTIDFPATGSWDTWGEVSTTVSLTAGIHTIYASTRGFSGANVDSLRIESDGIPLENIPPTADAGADQSVQVNNTITITGSGTDSDGTITAYEWKKDTTVLATTPSFSYTPDTVGTDTLTLTVTDNNGSIGIDSMDVVVTTDTPPPPSTLYEAEDAEISSQFTIASYHLDYTGTGYVDYAGEGYVKWTVDIAADGNYDVAFRYALGSGNRPLNISVDGTGGGTTIDFPATGSWDTWGEVSTTVSLTAGIHTIYASTRGFSGANVDSLRIESDGIPLENIPPTADAGADQSVQVNNTITITGSGTDSDGTITAYEWKKDTTVLATTPSFSYTPDTVGTDTLTLTVTDNNGSIGTDSMDVVVTTDTPPPPSTLYEAEDAEISSQFTIASYHLDYTGTGYVDYAGEGYVKWTVDIAADGNYDVAFRYALGSGNRPLNISVDGTGGGTTIDFPATGSWDTWGEVSTTVSLTAGIHTIYASTRGFSGANVDSLRIESDGIPLENIPPTADAGADQSVQVNNTITITGSGTDSDGTITAYEWKKDTTVLATTPSFSYTPDTVGTDTLTLTVTDNNGSIGTDSMDVVVTTDTPPPPSTLYEAEDAEISSQFTIASYHLDYTGTGYVDYAGEGYVKWTVDIAADGNYDVAFRYALGSGNRPLNISVDGTGGGTTIDFPATGSWDTWGEVSTTVSLTAGIHTIYASTRGFSGANIDHLSIVASGVTASTNIQLITPQNNHIQTDTNLTTNVLTVDLTAGWGVKFVLDEGDANEQIMTTTTKPYEVTFTNVKLGEHRIDSYIIDESNNVQLGDENHDSVENIGIGDILIAVGDSITFGYGDNDITDDISMDGRNTGGGFEPILNDYLSGDKGYPHSIINEGLDAETTQEGLMRLSSVLTQYPEASTFLLLYGTNNTSPIASQPLESGKGLNIGDDGYDGTYKDYIKQMIDLVNNAGKKAAIAKIPVVLGTSSSSGDYALPITGDEYRNIKTRDFNEAIDELVADPLNNIVVTSPDLYLYFIDNYTNEYFDNLHPNGLGYSSIADMWRNILLE